MSKFAGPGGFSAVEAATIMCTYGTVWHAGLVRGRMKVKTSFYSKTLFLLTLWISSLQPGERVLVTGSTGGVGTAAIHVANALVTKTFLECSAVSR